MGIISIILFNSCEQEVNDSLKDEQGTTMFKYKGVLYSGEINVAIKEKLATLPELAMYVDENGGIEYFDNYEDLLKNICGDDLSLTDDVSTKASRTVTTSYITLYKDLNYKGGSKTYDISSSGTRYVHISDLSSIGFSNNISSVKIEIRNPGNPDKQSMLTLWDDVNYKGPTVVFRVPARDNTWFMPDLRTMPRGVSGGNWNDAARSLKFNFFKVPTPWLLVNKNFMNCYGNS
ncbi:hypothetical protein DXA68_12345 [Bacteroides stercorirosoris]|uniref:Uncharacterized protein n=1 Tax=Bacteroides stercorirosoris TaxID=871324 RepID=A0A413H3W2_9BACE|nr:hypothetical protein DXA68_12345 [Bacteroides stercorirosoris]